MSAPASGPRQPWEQFLAQLTGLSSLKHGWGTEDDAKTAGADHVTWTAQAAGGIESRRFGLLGCVVEGLLPVQHVVTLYGGSPVVALQRAADLLGQLPLLLGPRGGNPDTAPPSPGWDASRPGQPIEGGELAAGAWMVRLTITLKLFVISQFYGAAPVQGFTVTPKALNPDGSTEPAMVVTS